MNKNGTENQNVNDDVKKLGYNENDVMRALMKLSAEDRDFLLKTNKINELLSCVDSLEQRELMHNTIDLYIDYYKDYKRSFGHLCEKLDTIDVNEDPHRICDTLISSVDKFKGMLESKLNGRIDVD
ncbi:hypothetical protein [Lacrimispora indolis]|uniref:hypothetical protein n=1 Tax=Lacrimispora indolis TaxID=69825 RepID=UPI000409750F|nr:hypothetical protein [[Clostridium] methoxybenzovorans]